jgi:hypothetical protein
MSGCYLKGQSLHLHVFAQPKASKSEIIGWHDSELKIRLAAPPVDGAANDELIKAIAKWFKVKKSDITIHTGQNSRHKHLIIENPSQMPDVVTERLQSIGG